MNYTVFYSWQSDLEQRFNRSFIQDALIKARKEISSDENFSINAVIDRDTYGLMGSPSIAESITAKISRSDIFVCDISIINYGQQGRPTPNPNVLFELGYASAILGWERIIMVQNTAYGEIEDLPFDLRGRRVLQYKAKAGIEQRSGVKGDLRQKLTDIFRQIFKHYSQVSSSVKEKIVWWGNWELDTKVKAKLGNISINRVASDAFFFELTLLDGARSGQIAGKAKITTPHSAYCRIKADNNEFCEINFRRRLEGNTWYIDVESGPPCQHFHGMNASFEGAYKHLSESVVNWGFLDEIDLNEISRMTGVHLPLFLDNFQQIFNDEHYDENGYRVITGGIKGLYTIMESIVVLDERGRIWCACLDPDKKKVRYFTNATEDERPQAMAQWMDRFPERSIVVNQLGKTEDL